MFQTIIIGAVLTVIGILLAFLFVKGSTGVKALCVITGAILATLAVVSLSLTSYWQFNYASDLIQQRGSTYNFVTQMLLDLDSDALRSLVSYSIKYLLIFSSIVATFSAVMHMKARFSYAGLRLDDVLTSVGCAITLSTFIAIAIFIPIYSPPKTSTYKLEAEVSESVIEHYRKVCPSNSSVSIAIHIYQSNYELTSRCGSSAGLSIGHISSFTSKRLELNDSVAVFEHSLMDKFKGVAGKWFKEGVRHEVMLKGGQRIVLVMSSKYTPSENQLIFHNNVGHLVSRDLTTFVEKQYVMPRKQPDGGSAERSKVQLH